MRHKVSELEGEALDAAVARIEAEAGRDDIGKEPLLPYSRSWILGGPIIERERIAVFHGGVPGHEWQASIGARFLESKGGYAGDGRAAGPTPLIAAMRAYVASKLGEHVELP